MQPRNTAILAALVLLCGAFVWFYEIEGAGEREAAETEGKRVFSGLDEGAITAVELATSDGQAARVERRAGAWWVARPVEFPGDGVALDAIAAALTQLDPEATLDDPQPLNVYGLGPGARRIQFEAESDTGGAPRVLLIGKPAPVGANTYVAAEGGKRVFTVPTWRVNAFAKTLDDLRDRRILVFDRTLVDRIEVNWPGVGVVLERDETQWRIAQPVAGDADDDAVASLLSDLSFLRAEGFIDAPGSDAEAGGSEAEPGGSEAELGLDAPAIEVQLRLRADDDAAGEGGAQARTLHFALGAERDGKRAARGEHLYLVAAERLADFPRQVSAYRFKQLSRFAPSEAKRIEYVLRSADGSSEVSGHGTLDEGDWLMEPPWQEGRARGLVTVLSNLEAADIAADWVGKDELVGLGFAPARGELRVFGEANEGGEPELLAEVMLGVADVMRGIAARRADRDEVFMLESARAEDLPVSLEAFRARFAALEPIEVESPSEAAAAGAPEPAG